MRIFLSKNNHCNVLERTLLNEQTIGTAETTPKEVPTYYDLNRSYRKANHTSHTMVKYVTTRNVTKSRNIKGNTNLQQGTTELSDIKTDLMNAYPYLNYSVLHYTDLRHINHSKSFVHNLRTNVEIFKPSPTIFALVTNQAPRLFNLFQENCFYPISGTYILVSIHFIYLIISFIIKYL